MDFAILNSFMDSDFTRQWSFLGDFVHKDFKGIFERTLQSVLDIRRPFGGSNTSACATTCIFPCDFLPDGYRKRPTRKPRRVRVWAKQIRGKITFFNKIYTEKRNFGTFGTQVFLFPLWLSNSINLVG